MSDHDSTLLGLALAAHDLLDAFPADVDRCRIALRERLDALPQDVRLEIAATLSERAVAAIDAAKKVTAEDMRREFNV